MKPFLNKSFLKHINELHFIKSNKMLISYYSLNIESTKEKYSSYYLIICTLKSYIYVITKFE